MTDFSLAILMTSQTVRALQLQGSVLIAYAAVQGSDRSALPLVWYRSDSYSNSNTLTWSTTWGAYASPTPIAAGSIINTGLAQAVRTGQTVNVDAGPRMTIVNGGTAGAIAFVNQTPTEFTCGIEQQAPGQPEGSLAPICAYPLFGENSVTIFPLPQIALLFTTEPLAVGEAFPGISDSSGPAILLDMSGGSSATLHYHANAGWSGQAGTTFRDIDGANFVSALIQVPPPPQRRTFERKEYS